MKTGKRRTLVEVEESSGNVFADIGLPNAEHLLEKSKEISAIHAGVKEQGMSDEVAAQLLGIHPPNLEALLRGDVEDRYTIDELKAMHQHLNEIRAKLRAFDDLRKCAKDKAF